MLETPVFRLTKGTKLTHLEVDKNFKLCENLKGYVSPNSSIGQDGDYYTIPEHHNILSSEESMILPEYSEDTNLWLFNSGQFSEDNAGSINDTANDVLYFKVNPDLPDTLEIKFLDNISVLGKYIILFGDEFEFELKASEYTDRFTINIPGLYSKTISVLSNSSVVSLVLMSSVIVNHQDFVKVQSEWFPYSNKDLIKNAAHGLSIHQNEAIDYVLANLPEVDEVKLSQPFELLTTTDLRILNPEITSDFGDSVAVNDSYYAVGSKGKPVLIFDNAGEYLYSIANPTADTYSFFGEKLAIHGNNLLVSAQKDAGLEDDGTLASDVGKVYLFDLSDSTLIHTISNPNLFDNASDYFGSAIAITDKYIIAGSWEEISRGDESDSGVVYVFDAATANLLHSIENPNVLNNERDGDQFGYSIAAYGNKLLVGANEESAVVDDEYNESGIAYLFELDTGKLIKRISNPNVYDTDSDDWFGTAVSINHRYFAVSAPGEDDAIQGSKSGVVYLYNLDGILLKTISNPNQDNNGFDEFGTALSMHNDYLLVGVPLEDEDTLTLPSSNVGIVYLFEISTGNLIHTFENPQPSQNSDFGQFINIYNDKCIIGANEQAYIYTFNSRIKSPYEISENVLDAVLIEDKKISEAITTSNKYTDANITKLREDSIGIPAHITKRIDIYNPDQGIGDEFGKAVKLTDKYIAISDNTYASDEFHKLGRSGSGSVKIFDINGNYIKSFYNPNAQGDNGYGDKFGCSIDIDGEILIVGAYGDSLTSTYNVDVDSGSAYVFNISTGALLHSIVNPNVVGLSNGDYFGNKVAVSGNICAITADGEDDAGILVGGVVDQWEDSGKVYLFDVTTGALLHTIDNPNHYGTTNSDRFGHDVSMSGTNLIVSSTREDVESNNRTGIVYVFNASTAALTRVIKNPTPLDGIDTFGNSISILGNKCIIGNSEKQISDERDFGIAYIFDITDGSYITLSNPSTFNQSNDHLFGYAVDISSDYAIVSAIEADEIIREGYANEIGKAYIFDTVTGEYILELTSKGDLLRNRGDEFGNSVSILGTKCIVGNSEIDDDAGETGRAYVFDFVINAPGKLDDTFAEIKNSVNAVSSNILEETKNLKTYTDTELSAIVDGSKMRLYSMNRIANPNIFGFAEDDEFGYVMDIRGDYAIISTKERSVNGDGISGAVHIYNVKNQKIIHSIVNPNSILDALGNPQVTRITSSAYDHFGSAVAISDTLFAVGAHGVDTATVSSTGEVYVYNIQTGALVYTIVSPTAAAYDKFGAAVSLSGDVLAIASTNSLGKVYLYTASTGVLIREIIVEGVNKICLENNYLLCGHSDITIYNPPVEITMYNASTGAVLYEVANPNVDINDTWDGFGYNIAMNSTHFIVSSSSKDDVAVNSGVVYVFDITDGSSLHTLSTPNIDGTNTNDYFGRDVDMSDTYISVASRESGVYILDILTGTLLHYQPSQPADVLVMTDDYLLSSAPDEYTYSGVGPDGLPFEASDSGVVYVYSVKAPTESILAKAMTYTDNNTLSEDTKNFTVVATMPAASLAYFEKSVYLISNSLEYMCVANTENPTTDAECFWIER